MIEMQLVLAHQKWAKENFPDSTAKSSLLGLKREIRETIESLENETPEQILEEYIDCFMYLLDSVRRAGFNEFQVNAMFHLKLEKNKKRNWNKNEDNSYSHIKS